MTRHTIARAWRLMRSRRALVVVAAAVAVTVAATLVAVAVVLFLGGRGVRVPDVTGLDEFQAAAALKRAGLNPEIKHRHDPQRAGSVTQLVPAGSMAMRGSTVGLIVSVNLSLPVVVSPEHDELLSPPDEKPDEAPPAGTSAAAVTFAWTQPEAYVTSWRITVYHAMCTPEDANAPFTLPTTSEVVTEPRFARISYFVTPAANPAVHSCPHEFWTVAAMDDFGNVGPLRHARYRLYQG